MKLGRNEKCHCGSGIKFKKCCMNKGLRTELGILRHGPQTKVGDDFLVRFLLQMNQIRSCAFLSEDHSVYDASYHPIFQNLVEAKLAKERCQNLIELHVKDVAEEKDGVFHGHQIDVRKPIDDDLNMYLKDFFIRGVIAIDCLMRHSTYIGYNVAFLFTDDEKKYKSGLKNFPLDPSDSRFRYLSEMIKHHRKNWYSQFREMRRKIEHEGFSIPKIIYQLDADSRVKVIFPKLNAQEINDVMNICWENLMHACEEILVLLLSLKLKEYMIIVEIPEAMRNAALPVKYAVRHRDFPQTDFSCG